MLVYLILTQNKDSFFSGLNRFKASGGKVYSNPKPGNNRGAGQAFVS
jgi:hypothetical protein